MDVARVSFDDPSTSSLFFLRAAPRGVNVTGDDFVARLFMTAEAPIPPLTVGVAVTNRVTLRAEEKSAGAGFRRRGAAMTTNRMWKDRVSNVVVVVIFVA